MDGPVRRAHRVKLCTRAVAAHVARLCSEVQGSSGHHGTLCCRSRCVIATFFDAFCLQITEIFQDIALAFETILCCESYERTDM